MVALDRLAYAPNPEKGEIRLSDINTPRRESCYLRAMERIQSEMGLALLNKSGNIPRRVRCRETGDEWESVVEAAGVAKVSDPTMRTWIRDGRTVNGKTYEWC